MERVGWSSGRTKTASPAAKAASASFWSPCCTHPAQISPTVRRVRCVPKGPPNCGCAIPARQVNAVARVHDGLREDHPRRRRSSPAASCPPCGRPDRRYGALKAKCRWVRTRSTASRSRSGWDAARTGAVRVAHLTNSLGSAYQRPVRTGAAVDARHAHKGEIQ